MSKPILFDVDGVLADWTYSYRKKVREIARDTGLVKDWKKITIFTTADRPFHTWGDPDIPEELDQKLAQTIYTASQEAKEYWTTMRPLVPRSTFKRIWSLREEGHSVYFVTSRYGAA